MVPLSFYRKLKIINSAEAVESELETPEMKKCKEKCEGQEWDKGFNDMVPPCGRLTGSSIFNSISITILFIISLVR